MSSTNTSNATTIVIDPAQSDDEPATPTRPPTLYPPPAAATANNEQSAPSGETAMLTPAMQVRMSLLRRLWAATVNMRTSSFLRSERVAVQASRVWLGTPCEPSFAESIGLGQTLTILRCSQRESGAAASPCSAR